MHALDSTPVTLNPICTQSKIRILKTESGQNFAFGFYYYVCPCTQWVYFLHDILTHFPSQSVQGNIGDHPHSKLKIHLQVEFIHHLLDLFQCEDCIRGVNDKKC